MIFSGLICPKITIKKKLNFLKKVWTNPFAKNSMFWIFIKVVFFWSLWKISIFRNFLKVLFTAQKSFFCIWNIQKRSFLAWFTQKYTWKIHMKKKLIFWQKAWISIFLTFLKVLFSGLKTNLFHLKYPETIFSGLMYPKIHLRKSSIFWQKAWTKPFGKVRYFGLFLKLHFFLLKCTLFYP